MPINGGPEISIVVPVYRNAETLAELSQRLRRVLGTRSLTYELILVNDACPEGSLAVLQELAHADSGVVVLALDRNVGQHRAVLAGLGHARGNQVVIMDADLQDPPEAIPALLEKLREGYGAVFAGRRGRYESLFRLFTSRLFKWVLHLLCGVPADAGLFVAISRQMAERLRALGKPGPFVVAMIGCTGLPVASIRVARAPRPRGGSAYCFRDRCKMGLLAIAWVLAWKLRPRDAT